MKESRKLPIILIIVVIVIGLLISFYQQTKTFRIDLGSYVEYEYVGANGDASIEYSFNEGQLEHDLVCNLESLFKERERLRAWISTIQLSLGPEVHLSNGDMINGFCMFSDSEWLEKGHKVNLGNLNFSFEVEGLEEPILIDLFEDLEIEVIGISPNGTIIPKNKSKNPFLINMKYELTPCENIAKGDTIIVTGIYDKKIAQKRGYRIIADSKTIVIDSIDEYVSDKKDIDETTLSLMEQAGADFLQQYFKQDTDTGKYRQHFFYPSYGKEVNFISICTLNIKEVKLVSNAFMVRKKEYFESIPDNEKKKLPNTWMNATILTYKISFVTDVTPSGKINIVYVPVVFSSIVKQKDNQIQFEINERASVNDRSDTLNGVYQDRLNPYQNVYTWEVDEFK